MSRTLVLFAIGVAAVSAASPSAEDIQNALDLLGLSKDDVDAIQSAKSRRASPAGPSIDTEDGNIVFSVENGKHVGFKFPDNSVVNVDELPAEMSEYADHGIKLSTAAMTLGYKVGSAKAEAQSTIATTLDFVKSTIEATARDAKAFTDKQDQVNKNLESGVDTKLAAFDAKMKSSSDALTNAVNTKLEQQTDATTASTAKLTKDVAAVTKTVTDMVKVMEKTAECASKGLSFNPVATTCCTADQIFGVTEKKCIADLIGTEKKPAKSCMAIFKKHKYGKSKNGMFYLDVGGTITAYCKFDGDYPGATLVSRKPGNVGGEQSRTGRVRYPCKPSTSSGQYCKLTDNEINILRDTSTETDPFVSLSYKNRNPNRPACRSFAHKRCDWNMVSASTGCHNSVVRNSGQYCNRGQKHNSYRGLDGYHCPNLNYNSNNKFRAGDGGVGSPGNPFVIWEHSGGTHYCGGWDTTWRYIELWIH